MADSEKATLARLKAAYESGVKLGGNPCVDQHDLRAVIQAAERGMELFETADVHHAKEHPEGDDTCAMCNVLDHCEEALEKPSPARRKDEGPTLQPQRPGRPHGGGPAGRGDRKAMKKGVVRQDRITRLGEILAVYRFMRKITVRDLGAEIGCAASTITRIELGYGIPDGPTCTRIFMWLLSAEAKP